MKIGFSIPRFLLIFFLLVGGYYTYIGICDPGGKLYSSFLDQYLNFTDWYAAFLSKSGAFLLNLFGMDAHEVYPYKIHFADSNGVTIGYTCMGAGINSFWIAFVAAHKTENAFKWKWLLGGLAVLVLLNIIRVALVAASNKLHWRNIWEIDHHTLFNMVCYVMILGMLLFFIKRIKTLEQVAG